MSQEEEVLCSEIRSFVNPLSFAQYPTHIFREIMLQYIRSTVKLASSSQNGVYMYDEQIIKKILFYSCEATSPGTKFYKSSGIPWGLLCASHDSSRKVSASNESSKAHVSALHILIDVLADPCIVPPCLTSVIVLGMLSVCVEVFSSASSLSGMQLRYRRPSSLIIIESAIMCMIQLRPSAMVSKRIERYVFERVMCNLSFDQPAAKNIPTIIQGVLSDYNTRRTLTILSIVNDLVSMKKAKDKRGSGINIVYRLQRQVILRPTILLLKEIDAIDVFLLQQNQNQKPKHNTDLCSKCRNKLFPEEKHKRKRMKTSSMGDLHGEASDDEKQSSISFSSRYSQVRRNDASVLLPWKKLMGVSGKELPRESCCICSKSNLEGKYNSSLDITSLPLSMIEFRASLYELVLESFASSMSDAAQIRHLMLSHCFRMSVRHHQSASIRLCAIFAANCAGVEKGLMEYLRFILKIIEKDVESCNTFMLRAFDRVAGCIHVYRELLKDCALFDDPALFLRGLRPLFDLSLRLNDQMNPDAELDPVTNKILKELLTSIGILMVKWYFMISTKQPSNEAQLAFNGYVLRFSDEFGSIDKWLDDRMSAKERSLVTSTLQKLGISSIFDSIEEDVGEEVEGCKKDLWIYDEAHSMRAAYIRMGPKVKSKNLFSDGIIETKQDTMISKRKTRCREDSICEEPILDFINDDITRVIFSYLGYKLLVRATSVCRSWKTIGNESMYWEPHFLRRFRPIFLEDMIPASINTAVKQAFIVKHCQRQALNWRRHFNEERRREKSLQSRISKAGWKHRHCRVFGCNVVIRKKEDEKKHDQVHLKDTQKKLAIIERAEKRRIVKLEREKLQRQAKASKVPKSSETKGCGK
jgi:hypothetical protein